MSCVWQIFPGTQQTRQQVIGANNAAPLQLTVRHEKNNRINFTEKSQMQARAVINNVLSAATVNLIRHVARHYSSQYIARKQTNRGLC